MLENESGIEINLCLFQNQFQEFFIKIKSSLFLFSQQIMVRSQQLGLKLLCFIIEIKRFEKSDDYRRVK